MIVFEDVTSNVNTEVFTLHGGLMQVYIQGVWDGAQAELRVGQDAPEFQVQPIIEIGSGIWTADDINIFSFPKNSLYSIHITNAGASTSISGSVI